MAQLCSVSPLGDDGAKRENAVPVCHIGPTGRGERNKVVAEIDKGPNVLPVVEIVVLQIPALHVTVCGTSTHVPQYCGVYMLAMVFVSEWWLHTYTLDLTVGRKRDKCMRPPFPLFSSLLLPFSFPTCINYLKLNSLRQFHTSPLASYPGSSTEKREG